jgi:hypothetical protein
VKHETMHVAQMMAGCDSTLAVWARDTVAKIEAEVQATCAGLEVYADSSRRAAREREAVQTLGLLYPKTMVSGQLYSAFTRWCHGGA